MWLEKPSRFVMLLEKREERMRRWMWTDNEWDDGMGRLTFGEFSWGRRPANRVGAQTPGSWLGGGLNPDLIPLVAPACGLLGATPLTVINAHQHRYSTQHPARST